MSDNFTTLLNSLPDILTVAEVASFFNVSEVTIYNWIKSGKLQATRVVGSYRITKQDLREFLENED